MKTPKKNPKPVACASKHDSAAAKILAASKPTPINLGIDASAIPEHCIWINPIGFGAAIYDALREAGIPVNALTMDEVRALREVRADRRAATGATS